MALSTMLLPLPFCKNYFGAIRMFTKLLLDKAILCSDFFRVYCNGSQIEKSKRIMLIDAVVFKIETFKDFLWVFPCKRKHRFDTCFTGCLMS